MILKRDRHIELDTYRTCSVQFNDAWRLFFGTKPPGTNPAGVTLTRRDHLSLARGMLSFADLPKEMEPYDGHIHNRPTVGGMYGRRR